MSMDMPVIFAKPEYAYVIILENKKFQSDYERLKTVSLNRHRHTATNVHDHCEIVRERVLELAGLNGCTEEETALL